MCLIDIWIWDVILFFFTEATTYAAFSFKAELIFAALTKRLWVVFFCNIANFVFTVHLSRPDISCEGNGGHLVFWMFSDFTFFRRFFLEWFNSPNCHFGIARKWYSLIDAFGSILFLTLITSHILYLDIFFLKKDCNMYTALAPPSTCQYLDPGWARWAVLDFCKSTFKVFSLTSFNGSHVCRMKI